MNVEILHLVGMDPYELPDGTTLGSELTITARVRVERFDTETVDVTPPFANQKEYLPGATTLGLTTLGPVTITG